MRKFSIFLALCLLPLPGVANTFHAADNQQAIAAARQARAGDEIVLAPGEFKDLTLLLTANATADRPLRLRAAHPGKTILIGAPSITVTGSSVEIHGLLFRNCAFKKGARGAVVFDGSADSLLTACQFENCLLPSGAALVSFRNAARDNRVATNHFTGTRYKSVMVVVDDASPKKGPPVRNRIDHNRFENVPPLKANGAETIQVGQRAAPFSDLRTQTLIENNEFVRCDGEAEIISIKSSGNVVRNNLFRNNTGELVMRHGHQNVIEGNRFEGGLGGIRLSGHGHIVRSNTIANCRSAGIRLYYGTPDLMHPASYLPVFDCLISNNVISNCAKGIVIGDMKNARLENPKWAAAPWFANSVMNCTIAPYSNNISHNTITGKPGTRIITHDAPRNTIQEND